MTAHWPLQYSGAFLCRSSMGWCRNKAGSEQKHTALSARTPLRKKGLQTCPSFLSRLKGAVSELRELTKKQRRHNSHGALHWTGDDGPGDYTCQASEGLPAIVRGWWLSFLNWKKNPTKLKQEDLLWKGGWIRMCLDVVLFYRTGYALAQPPSGIPPMTHPQQVSPLSFLPLTPVSCKNSKVSLLLSSGLNSHVSAHTWCL